MSPFQRLLYYIGIWAVVLVVVWFVALPLLVRFVAAVMPGGEASWLNTLIFIDYLGKALLVLIGLGIVLTAYRYGRHVPKKEEP